MTTPGPHLQPDPNRQYRYYEFVMAAFVAVYLCSNLIGPAKAAQLELPGWGPVTFGAGVLFFPVSYIFGDVLTEVYGYARARRVIWAGFAAMVFASVMAAVIVALPPAPGWANQPAYEIAFGSTWRIVGASLCAFFCGEFVNSFVLARMKVKSNGRHLWQRTIGSTIVGEGVDSCSSTPSPSGTPASSPTNCAGHHAHPVHIQGRCRGAVHPAHLQDRGLLKRAEHEDHTT
jgi:uncharacterized integral membrane protein (TIGR00697 family)